MTANDLLLSSELTDDAFLGGALRLLQPRSGYRAGMDAVLLAATVPAISGRGEYVLDVGAGIGTAGLCVARRVADVQAVLLERAPELARLAIENVARNDLADRVHVIEAGVTTASGGLVRLGLEPEKFNHVLANPPFHLATHGTRSRDPLKDEANAMGADDFAGWARFLARMTAPGGTVTLIHKAEALAAVLAAFERRFGAIRVLPIHAHAGEPAIRVLVQGVKGSRAPLMLKAGFVLHGERHAFTPAAEDILRRGAAMTL